MTVEKDENAPFFAEPRVNFRAAEDGTIYLGCPYDLPEYSRCVGDWLVKWAQEKPNSVFLAERTMAGDAWHKITFAQFFERVEELAGWLLETGVSADHPIAILSENSIDHALLAFAGMHIGVPVATISVANSLLSTDHLKLKAMIDLLDPGLIYVSDLNIYSKAVAAISDDHSAILLASLIPTDNSNKATLFSEARSLNNQGQVGEKFANVGPDTVARFLFTSGSTGTPKAVINTQRMLTSNQAAVLVLWPFLKEKPPVLVDWMPWSHTFGCNLTMNLVLRNGGSMYIDDGKPAPPLIHKTVQNIKDVKPTICFNVPRGYEMLLGGLKSDPEFRKIFFGMDLIFYGAAALPQNIWDQLIAMSIETTGAITPLVAGWGSTETAPFATSCYFQAETTGNIGLPLPGTELKLLANGDKLEVRVKGPNITPGYYKAEQKTQEAFDEEGFYMMGDAVQLADINAPEKGLFFNGRVSEDFKLSSGTWVNVGELRIAGIDALAPIAQDIVVAGHDHNEVGFLVFANEAACRKIAEAGEDVPIEKVLINENVVRQLADGLKKLKNTGGGSSRHAARARFLIKPPSPDKGEITDKAYLNQRQILTNRADDVELLQGNDSSEYIAARL